MAKDGDLAHRLAVRSITAFVSHEINHPLGTISNLATLLERRIHQPVVRPSEMIGELEGIKHEIRRAANVIKQLRILAGTIDGNIEAFNVWSFLKETVIPFRRRYPPAVVDIRVRCSSRDIVATGAPDLLHIALYNLMLNAVEATHDANRRKPRIELHAQTMGDGVLIDVIDNGPGVPQALEHSLFEPFVSGRRGGSGLGLAIVRDIVDWHGGSVRQEAAGARLGARFRLLLKGRNTNPHSEEREGI